MDNALYKYSPIVERPKLAWPKGARLAFYVGVNIEHYEVDSRRRAFSPVPPGSFPIRLTSAGATMGCASASGE